MSGTKRLASITRPAVNDSHTVSNTGAVERYFKKCTVHIILLF